MPRKLWASDVVQNQMNGNEMEGVEYLWCVERKEGLSGVNAEESRY